MTTKAKIIKIEKDIQVPHRRKNKYPWLEMEAGDSFFVEADHAEGARAATYYASKKYQRTFTCRKVDGGIRIWRTE